MPFAPIYNNFANSIFVPIQSLVKSTQSLSTVLNTNYMLGLPVLKLDCIELRSIELPLRFILLDDHKLGIFGIF